MPLEILISLIFTAVGSGLVIYFLVDKTNTLNNKISNLEYKLSEVDYKLNDLKTDLNEVKIATKKQEKNKVSNSATKTLKK